MQRRLPLAGPLRTMDRALDRLAEALRRLASTSPTPPLLTRPEARACSAWMAAAQDGDAEAYRSLLVAIGLRLAERGVADASAQLVLEAVHRARHTYRRDRPFEHWLDALAEPCIGASLPASRRAS